MGEWAWYAALVLLAGAMLTVSTLLVWAFFN
jgi:hypothetical protein